MFGKETSTFNVKTKYLNKLFKKKKEKGEKNGGIDFVLMGTGITKLERKEREIER